MGKIKTIIVEDELFDRKVIETVLKTNYSDLVEVVDSVGSVDEAIASVRKNKPDLLFLDIELNGDRNGAFNIIDQVGQSFKIIFVTARSEQDDLLKAIRLSCIDYLIKPTKISDFEAPLRKAYDELNNPRHENPQIMEVFKHNLEAQSIQELKISLQEGFSFRPVTIKNIVRCEAEGNYTRFYFSDNPNALINGNLKSFEERIGNSGFCRVNKHDLVNLYHIKSFSRKNLSWELLMSDRKTIYIAAPRKQSFLYQYNNLYLG